MKKYKKFKLIKRKRLKYKKMHALKIKKNMGFVIKPKNNFSKGGISVLELLIFKKSFITNLLKKKIKRKLDLYLDLILDADADSSSSSLSSALNEVSRFKDIIKFKYKKYLDNKYTKLLIKKIELLEFELKEKLMINYIEEETEYEFTLPYDINYDEEEGEKTTSRRR